MQDGEKLIIKYSDVNDNMYQNKEYKEYAKF